jgi:hypothetical protein
LEAIGTPDAVIIIHVTRDGTAQPRSAGPVGRECARTKCSAEAPLRAPSQSDMTDSELA